MYVKTNESTSGQIQYRPQERVHAGPRDHGCGSASEGSRVRVRGIAGHSKLNRSSTQGCTKVSKGRIVLINWALQNNKT